MAGHEGFKKPQLQLAAAYPSPENSPDQHPFYTPDGFDVNDPIEAEIYLRLVCKAAIPQPGGELDAKTGYHLAQALQREDRAAIYENGQAQNVAEHTANLVITSVLNIFKRAPRLRLRQSSYLCRFPRRG